MLSKLQTVQFGFALNFVIEQVTNASMHSEIEVYNRIKQMTLETRQIIWKNVADRINSTAKEVQEYYYNTWTLQFYQEYFEYKQQLIELFYDQIGYSRDAKDAILHTISEFQKQYPNSQCNERELYHFLSHLTTKMEQQDNMIKEPVQQRITNYSLQYEEYEPFRFQNAVQQLNIIQ
ncbi:Conserved_hypothetical protein [Hexamita inflata]|uniref:Uncharacterized protein n=1 Tax=Hexamita inflata TaxID=28002 RepID=A0ABP1H401_9EUKA